MKILRFIDKIIARVENWLVIASLSLMVLLTFMHILLRSVYTHAHIQWANAVLGQVDWTEPFVRLLVLWVTFLGASLLTRDEKHIKIDLMSSLLPQGLQPFRGIVLSGGCILISTLMLKASIDYLKTEIAFGGAMFLGIPTWIGQLILPVGFSMILFRFILRTIEQATQTIKGNRS